MMIQFRATIPHNITQPGQPLRVRLPDSVTGDAVVDVVVEIPKGLRAGDSFVFELEPDEVAEVVAKQQLGQTDQQSQDEDVLQQQSTQDQKSSSSQRQDIKSSSKSKKKSRRSSASAATTRDEDIASGGDGIDGDDDDDRVDDRYDNGEKSSTNMLNTIWGVIEDIVNYDEMWIAIGVG